MFATHYTVDDAEAVKNELVGYSISTMNDYAILQGYSVRFNGVDWTKTGIEGLNFTVYYDLYRSSDGYTVYLCFHGWGQDHLFRVTGGPYPDVTRALRSALYETVDRVNNGWVCND